MSVHVGMVSPDGEWMLSGLDGIDNLFDQYARGVSGSALRSNLQVFVGAAKNAPQKAVWEILYEINQRKELQGDATVPSWLLEQIHSRVKALFPNGGEDAVADKIWSQYYGPSWEKEASGTAPSMMVPKLTMPAATVPTSPVPTTVVTQSLTPPPPSMVSGQKFVDAARREWDKDPSALSVERKWYQRTWFPYAIAGGGALLLVGVALAVRSRRQSAAPLQGLRRRRRTHRR
jgi:hypothetical protein